MGNQVVVLPDNVVVHTQCRTQVFYRTGTGWFWCENCGGDPPADQLIVMDAFEFRVHREATRDGDC